MPIAFFTRTQTGALISRLNNDVIGAQQAFSDILSSVVGNLLSVVMVLTTMFSSPGRSPWSRSPSSRCS
jgi:ATP-binding cassette, subfamily B, bacterial